MDETEKTLILRAQRKDPRAFEMLVARYDRRILALIYDLVGHDEDTRDVFQDAMLSTYRALPGFRMQSSFFTWFYRIAVNTAIKFRSKYSNNPFVELDPSSENKLTGKTTPESALLNRELHEAINTALSQLSQNERLAFVLCHHQGLKIREAAEVLACSTGAVKSYLFRARDKMKSQLTAYLEAE